MNELVLGAFLIEIANIFWLIFDLSFYECSKQKTCFLWHYIDPKDLKKNAFSKQKKPPQIGAK